MRGVVGRVNRNEGNSGTEESDEEETQEGGPKSLVQSVTAQFFEDMDKSQLLNSCQEYCCDESVLQKNQKIRWYAAANSSWSCQFGQKEASSSGQCSE